MADSTIDVGYRLTGDDWYEYDQAILQPKRPVIPAITALLLMIPFLLCFVLNIPDWAEWLGLVWLVIGVFYLWCRAWWLQHKTLPRYYQAAAREHDVYITFSDTEVHVKSSGIDPQWRFGEDLSAPPPSVFGTHYAWESFLDYLETQGLFLLRQPKLTLLVPKRAFEQESLIRFRALLGQKLSHGEFPKPPFAA